MASMETLKTMYEKYEQTIGQVGKETSALSRLFDLGVTPRNHPANREFYDGVGRWVEDLLAEKPGYDSILDAVLYILTAAADRPPQRSDAHWFLMAAQGQAKPLIPLLTKEDRAAVRDRFSVLYPKRHRMPLQEEILKLLSK